MPAGHAPTGCRPISTRAAGRPGSYLIATPTGHLTLLVTKTGKSYAPNDLSEQFRKWCDDAGLPADCHFHGLRKTALTQLADAGCTVHQLAAVGGHASLKMVEHYTKRADQARLAREAFAKGTETPTPTSIAAVPAKR